MREGVRGQVGTVWGGHKEEERGHSGGNTDKLDAAGGEAVLGRPRVNTARVRRRKWKRVYQSRLLVQGAKT